MVITTMPGYIRSKHSCFEHCEHISDNGERGFLPLLLVLLLRLCLYRRDLRDLGPSEEDIAAEIATSGFGSRTTAWRSISKELLPFVLIAAVSAPWWLVSPVCALLLGEEELVAVGLFDPCDGGEGAAEEGDEARASETDV